MTLAPVFGRYREASGHFYTERGELVESVPNARGDKLIKPDIRHAKKLGLGPGVTTICGLAERSDLVQWQITQAILSALTLTRRAGEHDGEFTSRIREDAQEHAAKAAEQGTALHVSLCDYVRIGIISNADHIEFVDGAMTYLAATIGDQDWRSEVAVVSPYGYCTAADLLTESWLIDVKTKDGDADALKAMRPYESYCMQLAATMAPMQPRRAGILYVSRTVPGAAYLHAITGDEIEIGWQKFRCLLRFWQLRTGYRPPWATETP